MATVESDVIHQVATLDEVRDVLDEMAQEALAISGEEFLERWRAGDLDDLDPTVARLAVFARLLAV